MIIRGMRLLQIFRAKSPIIRGRRINRGTAIIQGNTLKVILRCYNLFIYLFHFHCNYNIIIKKK